MLLMHNEKGMTLVEIMIVVAIIIILAAFAVPEIREAAPNYRLRSLSYDILASSQRAKAIAVEENSKTDMCFYADRFEIQLDTAGGDCDEAPIVERFFDQYGSSRQGFTGGVAGCGDATEDWDGDPPAVVTSFSYSPTGTVNAGTIYLENGEGADRNNICYAITAISTGSMKIRKHVPSSSCDPVNDNKTCWIE